MDFIFGTYATDELKVVHHRALRRGIHHAYALEPRQPKPGQPVKLTAWTGTDVDIDQVAVYFTTDGSEPTGQRGTSANAHVIPMQQADIVWDTLNWGYFLRWECTLPAQTNGTFVRYRISAWNADSEIFAEYPDVNLTGEQAAYTYFEKLPFDPNHNYGQPRPGKVFTYQVNTLVAPAWAHQAIIYHIFVDRFYPGDGKDWLQTEDISGFFGGTLDGVREKLGYVTDLGANTIWLSPTWVSDTHHGYDAIDLRRTEARLGGDAALHRLVEAAHKRDIRVLLDLPCNHISNEHPIFVDAKSSVSSPYRHFFYFDDSPIGYRTFFNVPTMPQLNLSNSGARDWMIETAVYWLREFDIDGYRLDYASGPEPDFWSYFNSACKAQKADCYTFGEVIDAPENQRHYIGRLDGCLDFFLNEAMRKTFGWGTWTEAMLRRAAARHAAYFPADFVMPSFLDNHDMDRFLHIAKGDKDALRRAVTFQMGLPNPPVIFYGTEIGLLNEISSRESGIHIGRVPMLWDARQDRALFKFYVDAIRGRCAK